MKIARLASVAWVCAPMLGCTPIQDFLVVQPPVAFGAATATPPSTATAGTASATPAAASGTEDLRGARALDQQGVIAFEAGRYHDALLYFEASFAHGGPPSERWNAAKCHLRLDQVEQAEAELTSYLAFPLTQDDRNEGVAALDALRRRPSTVTITSAPPGLTVWLDGTRKVGVTPVSLLVPPGEHVAGIERGGDSREEHAFTARLGRAVLLEARP